MASVTYQHKKYFAVAADSNFLTRQHVAQATFTEEVPAEKPYTAKHKLQDFVLFAVFPASMIGFAAGDFLHRIFG